MATKHKNVPANILADTTNMQSKEGKRRNPISSLNSINLLNGIDKHDNKSNSYHG